MNKYFLNPDEDNCHIEGNEAWGLYEDDEVTPYVHPTNLI